MTLNCSFCAFYFVSILNLYDYGIVGTVLLTFTQAPDVSDDHGHGMRHDQPQLSSLERLIIRIQAHSLLHAGSVSSYIYPLFIF